MPPRSSYLWDSVSGRYRQQHTGRFASGAAIRAEIDRDLVIEARHMRDLTAQLQRGAIPLDTWRAEMRESVKNVHLYNAAAAKGGWAHMSPAAYGAAGQRVRTDYGFLDRWAAQIQDGTSKLDGKSLRRAELYGFSGRKTYEQVRAVEMETRGFSECRSVLHAQESCAQCIAEAAKGFQPASDMVPIGDRTCGHNCRCTVERRNSATGQVAA